MAGEQKYTVDIQVQGLQNLDRLNSKIDVFQKKILNMRTAIMGIGFAALGQSALAMADDLDDLSKSTGIAVARLVEFKKALSESGGNADSMAQGVTTFVRSIDEAAQGSLKAQNTFRDLGISLSDLRNLSEQELMTKAIRGLAGISDSSRRATIQMDLFGKSFRTVDAAGLADGLDKVAGKGDRVAESLKRAAELNDQLNTAAGNLKLAFLEAFEPAIRKLNEITDATNDSKSAMDGLVAAIKVVGAVLVTAFSAAFLLPLVTAIGTTLRGISAIGVALGAAPLPAWLIAATGAAARFLPALRAIALLFSAGLGIYTASQLFDNFASIALNALSRIVEGILEVTGAFLNLPTDAIAGLLNLFGADIKDPKGLGTPFLMARDALEKLRLKQEETAAANKRLQEETKKTGDTAAEAGTKIQRAVDTSAFENAAKAVVKIGDAFKQSSLRATELLQTEIALLGKSKEAQDLENARIGLSQRAADAVQQLRDAQATMSKELKEAGLGKVYEEQIQRIQELARAEDERLSKLIPQLAKAKALEEFRLYGIKQQQEAEDKLLAIQREIADLGLTDIEKKYRDIARAADDSAKAAIRAEEARRGAPLNAQEIEQYYKKAREGTEGLVKAQKKLYDESRTFSQGWNKAFKTYVENARDAASQATRLFDKFTQGLEDALVDFAKTGKFEWKNFVNSMLEELLRSQIKQTMASVLQMPNPFGSGNVSDMFGGLFGGLLGDQGASKGQSANNPMYVFDVSGGSGGPLGGLMGPQQGIGGGQPGGGIGGAISNVWNGIKNVGSGIMNTVGNVFGGISDAVGGLISGGGIGGGGGGGFFDSIASGIGDLFGGFFANGGVLPANKFGIVGENGPELISGPAGISPMGATNVTYNINAVDAASFQALVARDPGFIFAVSEQGRRGAAAVRR